MKWYSKYLPVYEKPFAEVPAETVAEVRAKLAERQSDRPLRTARRRFSKPSVCRGSAKRRPDAAMHASAD